jgi:hypothetical protein
MALTNEDVLLIERMLDSRFAASEKRIADKLEALETRILTKFHKWASPVESRMQT